MIEILILRVLLAVTLIIFVVAVVLLVLTAGEIYSAWRGDRVRRIR